MPVVILIEALLIVFTLSYYRVNHLGARRHALWIVLFAPIMLVMGIVAVARER